MRLGRGDILLAGVFVLGALGAQVQAQGCVCTRQNIPAIGSQGGAYMEGGKWQIFAGFRYFKSDRHFVGKEEQVNRQTEQSEVINWLRIVDVGATYSFNDRINLTFSAPFVFADRSNPLRSNGEVVDRYQTNAYGIGDVSVVARSWLLSPGAHSEGNIQVGLGIKLPTGNDGVRDTFLTLSGPVERTVDQSIQPGDGGVGMLLEAQGFRRLFKGLTFSAAGAYLFNPRDTNGVPTFRSRPPEAIMSVADQYVFRMGFSYPVLPERGVAISLAGRWEGVPAKDAIGGSNGFRRPGYSISLEPGVSLNRGKHSFGLGVPIALSRNRTRSLSDIELGRHGDAAFADFQIVTSYSVRF